MKLVEEGVKPVLDTFHQAHGLYLTNYTPPSGGAAPPGVGKVDTIMQYVMWGVSALLFAYFIIGLAKAGRARQHGGEADAAAPIWPAIAAIVLGASAAIWKAIAG